MEVEAVIADETLIRAARAATRGHRRDEAEAVIARYRQHCDVSRGPIPERCKAHERIAAQLQAQLRRVAKDEYDPERPVETECC